VIFAAGAATLQKITVPLDGTPVRVRLRGGFDGSGKFSASIEAITGATYVLESSYDLIDWNPICTNFAAGISISLLPPIGTNRSRFFRARALP